nr:hypothetical protein [Tanacetum cinerariifolium]
DDDDDDNDDEEEIAKIDEPEDTESEGEESFDPILRTPKDSRDDDNGEEDQGLRQESSSVSSFVTSMLNPISDEGVESIFMNASSPIAPLQTSTPIITPSTISKITTSSDAPIPPTTIPSAFLQNLPTFDSVFRFEDRVKSLEVNFSEFMQKNQFAEAVSNISVAAYLIEIELKKILIEKMKGNKSIQRSDEQRNLYKALVDAYEVDKTILESYGDTAILKRRRGNDDDQEGPSTGSDWGNQKCKQVYNMDSILTDVSQ